MGGFGTKVRQLVEMYSKCMGMVKSLNLSGKKNHSSRLYSRLGRQLRSDRRKVDEFYSSSLAKSGTSFEKGDGMLTGESMTTVSPGHIVSKKLTNSNMV